MSLFLVCWVPGFFWPWTDFSCSFPFSANLDTEDWKVTKLFSHLTVTERRGEQCIIINVSSKRDSSPKINEIEPIMKIKIKDHKEI